MTGGATRRGLLRAAAGGLAAALAGCPGGTPAETPSGTPAETPSPTATSEPTATATETPTPAPATTVAVVLDGAPGGLRKYRLEVSTDALARVTGVRAGLIDGAEFEVVAGGAGEPSVAVRAADLAESVGSFDGTETLATVAFGDVLSRDELALTVDTLVDDAGAAMDPARVSLSVSE